MKLSKIKTLDINALEWFDKVNGNSYFAANIVINYGTPAPRVYSIPFQYGYGDSYIHAAFKHLREIGEVKDAEEYTYIKDGEKRSNGFEALHTYCTRKGIILRTANKEN